MKKALRHKKSTKKERSWFAFFKRYFLVLIVAIVSFAATAATLHTSSAQPTCANSRTCTSDLSEVIDNNALGMFAGKRVVPPHIDVNYLSGTSDVLGTATASGEKHIYVDLSKQTLYAYQGTTQIFSTLISSGKWADTPVGNFHVWEKLVSTRMSGGEGPDAYDLPNVPYVMYFYHDFGIHGAYWHDNFGHQMSHGCVNMRAVDAKVVYDWADGPSGITKGTEVSICTSITDTHQCIQDNPISS